MLLVTGSVSQDVFHEIACALQEKDVAHVLALVEGLIADGKEPLRLAEDFITFFRDLLLMQTGGDLTDLLEFVAPEDKFLQLAHDFSTDMLYGFIDILAKTQQEMRFSHHTKIYLETALLKMAQFKNLDITGVVGVNSALEGKVATLENLIGQLTQQLQNGTAPAQQVKEVARPRVKSQNAYNAPAGRIQEVLKNATKTDINKIKAAWTISLSQMQKSQAALLADAEPVAASESAFVLKFKYDIHCQMVAENKALVSMFTQSISTETGILYEVLCIPEGAWMTLRENFIRENGLDQKKAPMSSIHELDEVIESEPYIDDTQKLASQDPLIVEAERMFGTDFVNVVED